MDSQDDRSTGVTATTATLPATATRALDFDALYRDARDDVFAYAATLLRDSAAAEDVTAQAFERAYKRRSRFDARRGTPRAWLFGIVRNAALDELRRRKRAASGRDPARRSRNPRPDEAAELAAERDAVRTALGTPRRARPRSDRAQVPRRALQRRARRRPRRQPHQRGHAAAPRHDQAPGGRRCLISRRSSATSAPPPTPTGRRGSTPASPRVSLRTAAALEARRCIALRDHMLAIGAVGATVSTASCAVVIVGVELRGRRRRASPPAAAARRLRWHSRRARTPTRTPSGDAGSVARPRRSSAGAAERRRFRLLRRVGAAALRRRRAADARPRRHLQRRADALHDARQGRRASTTARSGSSTRSAATSRPPTVSTSGRNASATLTREDPVRAAGRGLAQLSQLAHVKSRTQQAQDVTDQRSALEASVRDARADRDGLRARLAKADDRQGALAAARAARPRDPAA